MKKVLISVISCTLDYYPKFLEAQQQTWDSDEVDGVSSFYYAGRPRGLGFGPYPNTVCFDVDEAYSTMGKKDMLAYQWALESLEWDYMARVNASCYVRKKLLLEYCQSLPDSRLFQGVMAPGPGGRSYLWGGAQYLMSRDVVKAMVDNQDKMDHSVMEDIGMSWLVQDLGFALDNNGRCGSINPSGPGDQWLFLCYHDPELGGFIFTDFKDLHKARHQYFIRCKQDLKPDKTIWIMKQLKQAEL